MDTLALILGSLAGLVSLVCYVLVIIQMFQHGQTGLAVVCLVLLLCCGLGGLIAFVFGWMRARDWNITNLMTVWTVAFVIEVAAGVMNPAPYRQLQQTVQPAR